MYQTVQKCILLLHSSVDGEGRLDVPGGVVVKTSKEDAQNL